MQIVNLLCTLVFHSVHPHHHSLPPVPDYSRARLSSRNTVQATYVILFFLVATLFKVKRGKINFKNVFNLSKML